jgi:hypothetical protein
MMGKADLETLGFDVLRLDHPRTLTAASRNAGRRRPTTMEDLWLKRVDLGSYLGNASQHLFHGSM